MNKTNVFKIVTRQSNRIYCLYKDNMIPVTIQKKFLSNLHNTDFNYNNDFISINKVNKSNVPILITKEMDYKKVTVYYGDSKYKSFIPINEINNLDILLRKMDRNLVKKIKISKNIYKLIGE